MVILQRGWSTTAPWRRRFGAHPPSPVFLTGISGRNVWGPWAAQLRPGRFGLARPSPAGPRPFPPCLRLGLEQPGWRRGGGKFWAHERNAEPSFPSLALPPNILS